MNNKYDELDRFEFGQQNPPQAFSKKEGEHLDKKYIHGLENLPLVYTIKGTQEGMVEDRSISTNPLE